jgi:hypothetical protein
VRQVPEFGETIWHLAGIAGERPNRHRVATVISRSRPRSMLRADSSPIQRTARAGSEISEAG